MICLKYIENMLSYDTCINHDILNEKISHDLSVHVEIYLILYVLDSCGGHFGNMLILKMPPPLSNVITQKCNIEVLGIPKM